MARRVRIGNADVTQHVVQRGINRQAVFQDDNDRRAYLDRLLETSRHEHVEIHAYCLMTNHVHLLVTPRRDGALSLTMQQIGRRYVPYYNRRHGRTGGLWQGRFSACVITTDYYLLACYRYIEMNPVRAAIVSSPDAFLWTSFRHNGRGEPDPMVTPHATYLALAQCPRQRLRAYRELFDDPALDAVTGELRDALRHNHATGSESGRRALERKLGRRIGQRRSGRPRSRG